MDDNYVNEKVEDKKIELSIEFDDLNIDSEPTPAEFSFLESPDKFSIFENDSITISTKR